MLALVFGCLGLPDAARTQLHWQNMDSLFGALPKGFHVYKTTDSLGGQPNVAWYAEIDLGQKQVACQALVGPGRRRYTPQRYYDSLLPKPLLVVNGTFFSFADNRNLNLVISKGKLEAYSVPTIAAKPAGYYYVTRGALGIKRRGRPDVAWVFTDTAKRFAYALSAPSRAVGGSADPALSDIQAGSKGIKTKKWRVHTAIGGGPVLVQRGAVAITALEERLFVTGQTDRHPRTLMGYTRQNRLIVMAIEGRNPGVAAGATLAQEAQMLVDLGCVEGLNLDGGGSSCLLINGKPTIKVSDSAGQRPVPAVFTIAVVHSPAHQ
jgi:hypothetical protein